MFNEEFYPTPKEPSAGKGDIVDAIIESCKNHYRRYDTPQVNIDTIEIDNNLANLLKGKEYRVVHNDFLTFNTMKKYNLIIMNPPFSNGDKHLLKALDMQKDGGGIICILNAETIKNPYTNTRKDLVNKLTDLNANIEYIENAFTHAENSTTVEIALIKVYIPEKEKASFIFDKLQQKEQCSENIEIEHQELIEGDYIKEIVDRYNIEVSAGVELINEYNAMKPFILKEIRGEDKEESMLKLVINNYRNSDEITINNFIREIRGKYWRALFNNPKFVRQLTGNLQTDLYNKIEELKDYDFSLYNILSIQCEMHKNISKGIEATILALFEEFSNKYHWYNECSKNIHYYNVK